MNGGLVVGLSLGLDRDGGLGRLGGEYSTAGSLGTAAGTRPTSSKTDTQLSHRLLSLY